MTSTSDERVQRSADGNALINKSGPELSVHTRRNDFDSLNYPLSDPGRSASRLLFDFGIAVSCFLPAPPNHKVLDFGCGTGWTSELLNKLGYDVYGFDIDGAAIEFAKNRARFDQRIDISRFHLEIGNGHRIHRADGAFGHVFCFDSLHHMADYEQVFLEIHRVLAKSGRAIFVEPGSRHSQSPETIRFLQEFRKDESWIEKDVDLAEVSTLARKVGFTDMTVKPFLLPANIQFSYDEWYCILENPAGVKNIMQELRRFVWEDRVIFHMTRN